MRKYVLVFAAIIISMVFAACSKTEKPDDPVLPGDTPAAAAPEQTEPPAPTATPVPAPVKPEELSGVWIRDEQEIMRFNENGACFEYTKEGDVMSAVFGADSVTLTNATTQQEATMSFSIDGETMTMELEGYKLRSTRVGEGTGPYGFWLQEDEQYILRYFEDGTMFSYKLSYESQYTVYEHTTNMYLEYPGGATMQFTLTKDGDTITLVNAENSNAKTLKKIG